MKRVHILKAGRASCDGKLYAAKRLLTIQRFADKPRHVQCRDCRTRYESLCKFLIAVSDL